MNQAMICIIYTPTQSLLGMINNMMTKIKCGTV